MYLIQIIFSLFFLLAIVKTIGRAKRGEISKKLAGAWALLWLAGIVVVQFPNSTFPLARMLGVQRGADLVVYVALVILFFVVFRLLTTVERLQRDVVDLTRKLALQQSEK